MPVHDWTRVPDSIFHHFHHGWIEEIARFLNHGHLPEGFYALAEQLMGRRGPDVLTLHPLNSLTNGQLKPGTSGGGVLVTERKPKVRFHARTNANTYVGKAKTVTIRHASDHALIAMVEVVSPGNKSSRRRFDSFVHKAEEALAVGIHLLIADLFPPTPRDPEGIHRAIWQDRDDEFVFSSDKPFTCVSYVADPIAEAFVKPIGLGDKLPEMPLFLTTEVYVPLTLETT